MTLLPSIRGERELGHVRWRSTSRRTTTRHAVLDSVAFSGMRMHGMNRLKTRMQNAVSANFHYCMRGDTAKAASAASAATAARRRRRRRRLRRRRRRRLLLMLPLLGTWLAGGTTDKLPLRYPGSPGGQIGATKTSPGLYHVW